jgi:hypothetical protein
MLVRKLNALNLFPQFSIADVEIKGGKIAARTGVLTRTPITMPSSSEEL